MRGASLEFRRTTSGGSLSYLGLAFKRLGVHRLISPLPCRLDITIGRWPGFTGDTKLVLPQSKTSAHSRATKELFQAATVVQNQQTLVATGHARVTIVNFRADTESEPLVSPHAGL